MTGTATDDFTVTLSAASNQSVTVHYTTADGTATSPTDYTATSGTVTFAPGQTTEQIAVVIQGDTANNAPETMQVNLTSPTNATILTPSGIGTIDDIAPTISINNPTFIAPLTGSATDDFTVTLSAASNQTVTVNYTTADGTATSPTDYTATTGTVTFAAGQTSEQIAVVIQGDTANNAPETMQVNLSSPTNATILHQVAPARSMTSPRQSPSIIRHSLLL